MCSRKKIMLQPCDKNAIIMLRYFFSFMLLVHGSIHLLGPFKAFGYGRIGQLSNEISKPAGLCWFAAAVLFIIAAVLVTLKKDAWWMFAVPAMLISQVLIIQNWRDAKPGTAVNLIILVVSLVAFASWSFNSMVRKEVTLLLNTGITDSRKKLIPVNIPAPVEKWLNRSGVNGKELIHTARLKQKGFMLSKPGGKWLGFMATQYFNTDRLAFNWQTRVKVMPLIYMDGRDKLENGKGEMQIRLLSVKTVAESVPSIETNKASMLRYLGEMCWLPSGALDPRIRWNAIDSNTARATLTCFGYSVTGLFGFTDDGDIKFFEAMRYGDFNGKISLEKWHVECKAYKVFSGIRIPYQCEVTWKLPDGDFTWLTLEIEDIDYNNREIY